MRPIIDDFDIKHEPIRQTMAEAKHELNEHIKAKIKFLQNIDTSTMTGAECRRALSLLRMNS